MFIFFNAMCYNEFNVIKRSIMENRNWTVLIIGGASGTGKSTVAYEIAKYYGISVLEFDDIQRTVKTVIKKTNLAKDMYIAIHDLEGDNWIDLGVDWNVNWLKSVSKEMFEFLKEIVERHVDENVPVIIEGDFIIPELVKTLLNSKVKSIFVLEGDKEQIINNYMSREGGDRQTFRADISVSYNNWIQKTCEELMMDSLESRPWNNALDRANKILKEI